jgi:hypothetical protein
MQSKYKYLFGSKMLKLENPRDEDWITFVDAPRNAKLPDDGEHKHRKEFEMRRIDSFVQGKNEPTDSYKALIFYQLSSGFEQDPDYIFGFFNILEHKKVWADHLKNYMNQESTEKFAHTYDNLHKKFYHILYQYYMITEDTHFISDEARANVQKIHDLEMPASYFYELKEMINSLEIHN